MPSASDPPWKEDEAYAVLGYALVHFSRLEFAIDDFMFKVADRAPRVARGLSKAPPRQNSEKIDFVIQSFISIGQIRRLGDEAGVLNLNAIGYMLDEIFDLRNHLAHGRLWRSSAERGVISIGMIKYRFGKRGDRAKVWKEEYSLSTNYVRYLVDSSRYVASLLSCASSLLDGQDPIGDGELVRKNRARLSEFPEIWALVSSAFEGATTVRLPVVVEGGS